MSIGGRIEWKNAPSVKPMSENKNVFWKERKCVSSAASRLETFICAAVVNILNTTPRPIKGQGKREKIAGGTRNLLSFDQFIKQFKRAVYGLIHVDVPVLGKTPGEVGVFQLLCGYFVFFV